MSRPNEPILTWSGGVCTYSEDGGTDGVHHEGLDVVRSHFFAKHRQGVVLQSFPVVHIEPPEDAGPTCRAAEHKHPVVHDFERATGGCVNKSLT